MSNFWSVPRGEDAWYPGTPGIGITREYPEYPGSTGTSTGSERVFLENSAHSNETWSAISTLHPETDFR
eukprot:2182185-Rhodomonas_salina.1